MAFVCGNPDACLKLSKRCTFTCKISNDFKSGRTVRELLSADDEIDYRSLRAYEKMRIDDNNQDSMRYKIPYSVQLTNNGWIDFNDVWMWFNTEVIGSGAGGVAAVPPLPALYSLLTPKKW